MKIYTCRICGEVYIGKDAPPSCPFCGAASKYLVMASAWKDENIGVEPTEAEKENLKKALDLEMSNTSFYRCIAKTIDNIEIAKMFKGLAKVEAEHAQVYQKLLKLEQLPEVNETCTSDIKECLANSLAREKRATEFYQKALAEATTERVKTVFEAIMNVEKDHIELDEKISKKY